MKKFLSLLLALTMVFSVCSFAAFAEEPAVEPADDPAPGPEYSGYIALDYTNEDGTPKYEVDPQWGAVFNVTDVIYDGYDPEYRTDAEGIEYIESARTLLLSDLDAADRILRTSFFPEGLNIVVSGDCRLGMIEGWQAGLVFSGKGSLTVNEKRLYETAIDINADNNDSVTLDFGTDVTVTLYEGSDKPLGSAVIRRAAGGEAGEKYSFDGAHNGTFITDIASCDEVPLSLEGYQKEMETSGNFLGWIVERGSDPDGTYVGSVYTQFDRDEHNNIIETESVSIKKLIYSESLGGFLIDWSFSDDVYEAAYGIRMTLEEFSGSEYGFKVDENGDNIPLYNPFDFEIHAEQLVYTDGKGNNYVMDFVYNDAADEWEERYVTYEPVEGMEGQYILSEAEDVPSDLSIFFEDYRAVRITGYIISVPDNSIRIATKMKSASDPDGIYGMVSEWDHETEQSRESIVRFLYDEAFGIYVRDESFEEIFLSGESFDTGDFSIDCDENGSPLSLSHDGFYLFDQWGDAYQDEGGNLYIVNRYYDEEREHVSVYRAEPISVLENRYLFTVADGIDPGTLERVYGTVEDDSNKLFILKADDGVFVYRGSASGAFSLSGTVESFLPEQGNHAQVSVYKEGEEAPVATQVLEGTVSAYRIDGLSEGSYTVKVDKAYHVAREYQVELTEDTKLDMKICPVGDITLDGKVNIRDVNKAYNHTTEVSLVTDPYAIQCGDVARHDNVINIRDVNALYNHVSEITPLY